MNSILRCFYLSALLFALLSCSEPIHYDDASIKRRCEKLADLCDPACIEKKFRACYVDTELFPNKPYDLFKHCHAVHVGDTCTPCSQIFSLNFGGAMRDVGCEEFHRALVRKNKQCGDCLVRLGDAP